MNISEASLPMQTKFNWSDRTQGYVLSAFFWGYVLGQVPGGYLAVKYGGKNIFGAGVLATAVLTLFIPLCAPSVPALISLRALMGFFEACTFPAVNVMFSAWLPAKERSFLITVANSGAYMGQACAFPISGYLINMAQVPAPSGPPRRSCWPPWSSSAP